LEQSGLRSSVRVVLIDPNDRVLLLGAREPADGRVVWFVPGGGSEPGESLEQTARRELAEEIGLRDPVELQGPVWTRTHQFTWNGRVITQHETFFLCRLPRSVSAQDIFPEGPEGEFFAGAKWLHPTEVASLSDIVAPRRMAELLLPLLEGELPDEPIDVGT